MPQLDKVSFLSQFFWLCFFFIGFYFILLKDFLPKMSRILKLRKKKIFSSQEGVNFLQQENQQIRLNFENILTKGFRISKESFNNSFQQTSLWVKEKIKIINHTHFFKINKNFINSVGETSFSENIALSFSSITFPQKLLLLSIIAKIKIKPVVSFISKKEGNNFNEEKKNKKNR